MDTLLLKHIVDGTNKDDMVYLPILTPGLDELKALNLIETNVMIKDSEGNIAVRATPEGLAFKPKWLTEGTKMSLVIENIPVVKPERKSIIRAPQYPELRDLEVGTSSFIEGIDEKKAQSLINSTERHFSTIKGQKTRKDGKVIDTRDYPRKFAFIRDIKDGKAGIRIGRTA